MRKSASGIHHHAHCKSAALLYCKQAFRCSTLGLKQTHPICWLHRSCVEHEERSSQATSNYFSLNHLTATHVDIATSEMYLVCLGWLYYIKDLPSVFFEENYPFILNQSSSGFVIEEFEKVLAKILQPKVKQKKKMQKLRKWRQKS